MLLAIDELGNRSSRHAIFALVLSISIGVTGCATRGTGQAYRPLVDTKNVNTTNYEVDLRECQQYAAQVAGAAEQAVAGAAGGAVLGALLAAAGGRRYSRSKSAAVGAVAGAAGGAASGEQNQRSVITRCLSGRGYRVLQ